MTSDEGGVSSRFGCSGFRFLCTPRFTSLFVRSEYYSTNYVRIKRTTDYSMSRYLFGTDGPDGTTCVFVLSLPYCTQLQYSTTVCEYST